LIAQNAFKLKVKCVVKQMEAATSLLQVLPIKDMVHVANQAILQMLIVKLKVIIFAVSLF